LQGLGKVLSHSYPNQKPKDGHHIIIDEIREAVGAAHLNLRLAISELFIGGKRALDWSQLHCPLLRGRV
jgi:hypothetical protein